MSYQQMLEEQNYNPQPEAINCLTEARMFYYEDYDKVQNRISKLIAQGFHLLMIDVEYHCNATDAFVGYLPNIVKGCFTRQQAEEALKEDYPDDYDIYII